MLDFIIKIRNAYFLKKKIFQSLEGYKDEIIEFGKSGPDIAYAWSLKKEVSAEIMGEWKLQNNSKIEHMIALIESLQNVNNELKNPGLSTALSKCGLRIQEAFAKTLHDMDYEISYIPKILLCLHQLNNDKTSEVWNEPCKYYGHFIEIFNEEMIKFNGLMKILKENGFFPKDTESSIAKNREAIKNNIFVSLRDNDEKSFADARQWAKKGRIEGWISVEEKKMLDSIFRAIEDEDYGNLRMLIGGPVFVGFFSEEQSRIFLDFMKRSESIGVRIIKINGINVTGLSQIELVMDKNEKLITEGILLNLNSRWSYKWELIVQNMPAGQGWMKLDGTDSELTYRKVEKDWGRRQFSSKYTLKLRATNNTNAVDLKEPEGETVIKDKGTIKNRATVMEDEKIINIIVRAQAPQQSAIPSELRQIEPDQTSQAIQKTEEIVVSAGYEILKGAASKFKDEVFFKKGFMKKQGVRFFGVLCSAKSAVSSNSQKVALDSFVRNFEEIYLAENAAESAVTSSNAIKLAYERCNKFSQDSPVSFAVALCVGEKIFIAKSGRCDIIIHKNSNGLGEFPQKMPKLGNGGIYVEQVELQSFLSKGDFRIIMVSDFSAYSIDSVPLNQEVIMQISQTAKTPRNSAGRIIYALNFRGANENNESALVIEVGSKKSALDPSKKAYNFVMDWIYAFYYHFLKR